MHAIYNEIEPYACDWLDNLVAAGHIAAGRVERRSIAELGPDDLAGPGQRHFFAGIGVWSYALRLAGWPDGADVWTGSCPCQPFSSAGKRRGTADERHLWPEWRRLIAECSPPVVIGEQVSGDAGVNWIAAVRADLEALGYAVGAADLCAASVGAPHIRQRIYWVAYANKSGFRLERSGRVREDRQPSPWDDADRCCATDYLGRHVARPVEPGAQPLVDGSAKGMGPMRAAYGNAIVAPLAAEWIRAVMYAIGMETT